LLPASCWFLPWLTVQSWRWWQYVPPKHWLTSIWLQSITYQKTTFHKHNRENLKSYRVFTAISM
jgi:hypothetical protein